MDINSTYNSSFSHSNKKKEAFNFNLKRIYYSFQDRLFEEIKNNEFCYNNNNECYLMVDSWSNKLNNIIKENLYNKRNIDYSFSSFLYNGLEFVDNFWFAIDLIKKKNKFKIINKDLLQLIYSDYYLENLKTINYFCGNNRFIIEFDEDRFYCSIIIVNPLLSFFQNPFGFINEKKDRYRIIELYKKLLFTEKNIDNFMMIDLRNKNEIYDYKQIILNGDILYNKIDDDINFNFFNLTELKIIYFFCYKNYFSQFDKYFFKSYKKYYLINSEWLFDYKNSSNYNKINNLLLDYYNKNTNLNVDNFEGHIYTILYYYQKNENFKNNKKNQSLENINNIIPKVIKKYDIELYDNCFIAHEIFINIINKYHKLD